MQSIVIGAALAAFAWAGTATAQVPRVGVVEHYGSRSLALEQVDRALGIAAGDSLSEDSLVAAMKAARARLSSVKGVAAVGVDAVCCLDQRLMIFVGFREVGVPGPQLRAAPHGTAKLPEAVMAANAPFDSLVSVAVMRGDATEDDMQGHALSHAPELRAIQERFVELARVHLDTLRIVLRTAADPGQRAIAARVIAYAPDKRDVVSDLVAAAHDPDDAVRNNAVRALAVIAVLAGREPARAISVPAAPFVDLLNSVVWSDLNKSALALDRITAAARDSALFAALRPRGLSVLADMARWRSAGHAQPAFNILGRVAGLGEGAIAKAWEDDRASVIAAALASRAGYPAHWWAPVPKEGAPAWEILPQEAGPGEVILSKRHELGLLSNFAPTPFVFHGRSYASLEGFWQMMLYPEGDDDPRAKYPGLEWKYTREEVTRMTSFEAKRAGDLAEENMRRMGIGWVSFEGRRFDYRSPKPAEHYRLIVAATREKVRQNDDVRRVLLATGDLVLKPDHHQEPDAPPEWRYFEILTRIRAELQGKR
jgi:HEAT repeat protein